MNYILRFEKRVFKDLDRIPERDLVRIDKTIQALALQPHPVGVRKLVGEENLYRVRQGDYRIIYTVDYKAGIISILGVRHRRDAYR
jgi:mRNA interferase RelE/StbE